MPIKINTIPARIRTFPIERSSNISHVLPGAFKNFYLIISPFATYQEIYQVLGSFLDRGADNREDLLILWLS